MHKEKSQNKHAFLLKALIQIAISLVIVIVFSFYFQRYVGIHVLEQSVSTTSAFVTVIGIIYAVIAGFTILIAFDGYKSLQNAINQELSNLGDLLDLTQFVSDKSTSKDIIQRTYSYSNSIANDEWKVMPQGKFSLETTKKLDSLFGSVNKIRNQEIKGEFIQRLTQLTTLRTQRISFANKPFPPLLTYSLTIISLAMIVSANLMVFHSLPVQIFIIGIVTIIVVLIFNLVSDLSNPFVKGMWHIPKEVFENLQTSLVSQRR